MAGFLWVAINSDIIKRNQLILSYVRNLQQISQTTTVVYNGEGDLGRSSF
jgi:hypothetical protein